MDKKSLEKRLQSLVSGNSESNRTKWALEWKKQGKKVVGVACSYVPHEVIYAAGMLPWRLTGTWSSDIHPEVTKHRPISTDLFYTHILDARVKGQLDFLDGAVFTNRDDDMRRLYDVWTYAYNTPFCHILFVPYHKRDSGVNNFRSDISKLAAALGEFGGKKITKKSLLDSIKEYNKMRKLLASVYELRKRERPALTGAEVLGITTAAQVMPVDVFNQEMEALLPYLEERTAIFSRNGAKRLLVSSDALDNPAFMRLVEDAGAIVVMDDLDTGSRWFWKEVDMKDARQDPLKALAFRYLTRPACPRMSNWPEQIEQVMNWAREYKVDGVIDTIQICNYPRQFRGPLLRKALEKAGIPIAVIMRDYAIGGEGQLKTRVEAFLEMLAA